MTTKLIVVKCVDNKPVLLDRTLYGIEPIGSVKRYSKNTKTKIGINCPAIMKQYNKHMDL